ncbi:MAG: STAS domain-containing protein, partial [Methylobacter sp.]
MTTNPNEPSNGRFVIESELSIYTVLGLKQQLLAALAAADELELDLSGVGEFDGASLQLLVAVKREAAAAGKALRIGGHSPAVVELLDLSGLAGFFGDPLLIVG